MLVCLSGETALTRRIGEKYTEAWRGKLSLDYILAITTLYWLTDTYPSSIYPYRFVC